MSIDPVPRFLGDVTTAQRSAPGPLIPTDSSSSTVVLSTLAIPFSPVTSVTAHGHVLCVGEGKVYEVHCHDVRTNAVTVLRVIRQPRPVTPEMRRNYVEEAVRAARLTGAARDRRIREIEGTGFPPVTAAYRRMKLDDRGRLWVQDEPDPGSPMQLWNVFANDGRHLGAIRLPRHFMLHSVLGDRMFTTHSNDNGSRILTVFSLGEGGTYPPHTWVKTQISSRLWRVWSGRG
jgi:hypothetical protein